MWAKIDTVLQETTLPGCLSRMDWKEGEVVEPVASWINVVGTCFQESRLLLPRPTLATKSKYFPNLGTSVFLAVRGLRRTLPKALKLSPRAFGGR